jgi:hypothetical protein
MLPPPHKTKPATTTAEPLPPPHKTKPAAAAEHLTPPPKTRIFFAPPALQLQ